MRPLHHVLQGSRDRPFRQARRDPVQTLHHWHGLQDLQEAPGRLPGLRMFVDDGTRPSLHAAPRQGRHDPHGGRGFGRISSGLRPGQTDGVAPPFGVQAPADEGQGRPRRGGQGRAVGVADLRQWRGCALGVRGLNCSSSCCIVFNAAGLGHVRTLRQVVPVPGKLKKAARPMHCR